MSEKAVPPCHRPSLAEKLSLNSTFGRLSSGGPVGGAPPYHCVYDDLADDFKNVKYRPVFDGHRQLVNAFNQEKPMNECQTPKPAYKPGDRVLYLNPGIGEPGTTIEVVFICLDPEQPTVALVRDAGNVNAPIRGVHSSHIKAMPKTDQRVVEVFARASRSHTTPRRCIVEHITDFSDGVDSPHRIIDARVTEDGILQVLVDMNASLKVDAIKAAIANPCVSFTRK